MTYFFIAGIVTGLSATLIFLGGKIYQYRKELLVSKQMIDMLEHYNADLQFSQKGANKEVTKQQSPANRLTMAS